MIFCGLRVLGADAQAGALGRCVRGCRRRRGRRRAGPPGRRTRSPRHRASGRRGRSARGSSRSWSGLKPAFCPSRRGVAASLVRGPGRAARARRVRLRRRREEEVERVLGAVVERLAGLGGNAFERVAAFAEHVRAALALGVIGEHQVTALGQCLGGEPVELSGAWTDPFVITMPGRLAGPAAGRPDVTRERRAVARGEEHRPRDSVTARLPVVEPHVAGAAVAVLAHRFTGLRSGSAASFAISSAICSAPRVTSAARYWTVPCSCRKRSLIFEKLRSSSAVEKAGAAAGAISAPSTEAATASETTAASLVTTAI